MFNWFKKENTSANINNFHGEAIVSIAIRPHRKGQVFWRGGYWSAKCHQSITLLTDEVVEVEGIDEITLLVKPIAWQ